MRMYFLYVLHLILFYLEELELVVLELDELVDELLELGNKLHEVTTNAINAKATILNFLNNFFILASLFPFIKNALNFKLFSISSFKILSRNVDFFTLSSEL